MRDKKITLVMCDTDADAPTIKFTNWFLKERIQFTRSRGSEESDGAVKLNSKQMLLHYLQGRSSLERNYKYQNIKLDNMCRATRRLLMIQVNKEVLIHCNCVL